MSEHTCVGVCLDWRGSKADCVCVFEVCGGVKEGGYKNGYLACRSGSHVSLLIRLLLFLFLSRPPPLLVSKLRPSPCIRAPRDFGSSDWEILQAVITESRCIGGLFVLDETGFMFQKMSACWCIKWFGTDCFFFLGQSQFKVNERSGMGRLRSADAESY